MAIFRVWKEDLITRKGDCVHIILGWFSRIILSQTIKEYRLLIHAHHSILLFCSVCFRMLLWRSFHFPNKGLELFAFFQQMVQFPMLRFDSLILPVVLWHMRCGPSLFSSNIFISSQVETFCMWIICTNSRMQSPAVLLTISTLFGAYFFGFASPLLKYIQLTTESQGKINIFYHVCRVVSRYFPWLDLLLQLIVVEQKAELVGWVFLWQARMVVFWGEDLLAC